MTFNPSDKISNIRGKDYLEVKWRIVWFRDEHPNGEIVTEIAYLEPLIMKATIKDENGNVLGVGHGSPKTQGVSSSRPFEGAETAAVGRALAHAGYGTQFTGEEEGEHLADSPVEPSAQNGKASPESKPGRPFPPDVLKSSIADAAKVFRHNQKTCTATDRKVVASTLDTIFDKDSTKRYELCKWLVGESSTKKMGAEYIHALMRWLDVKLFGDDPNEDAITEANNALPEALKASGQQEMSL